MSARDEKRPYDHEIERSRRQAMEFAGIGLLRYGFDGQVHLVNRSALRIFDLEDRFTEPGAAGKRDIREIFRPADPSISLEDLIREHGSIRNYDYCFLTLKGERKWILCDGYLVHSPEAGSDVVQIILRDITARKRAEEELRRQNEELEHMMEDSTAELALVSDQLQQAHQDREQTEEILKRGVRILKAVAQAAETLLTQGVPEQGLEQSLDTLGTAAGVGRIQIFTLQGDPEAPGLERRHRWGEPGGAPWDGEAGPLEAGLEGLGLGRWRDTLRRDRPVHGVVRLLPVGERDLLSAQGIRSLAAIPMFLQERWLGLLTFEDLRREREWREDELEVLRAAVDVLTAAILRPRRDA